MTGADMSIRRTDLSCFSLTCRYATSLVVVCEFGGNVISLSPFLTVGEVGDHWEGMGIGDVGVGRG